MSQCCCPALSAICLVDAGEVALLYHRLIHVAEMGHQMAEFEILQSGARHLVKHTGRQARFATLCDLGDFSTIGHSVCSVTIAVLTKPYPKFCVSQTLAIRPELRLAQRT